MNTGQACSHQPHEVQAQTVSAESTPGTRFGSSGASPFSFLPVASSFWLSHR